MKINKKMCIWIGIVFIISLIVLSFTKPEYITLINIFIAISTGSFLSLYTSIVNYLHEREEFFNNLFFTGIFINSNYEQIRQLILNLDEKSNMKYVINTIEGYAKAVDNIIANVNFAKYSPFFKKSKISQLTNQIQDLYIETERSIVIMTRNIKISGIESEITTLKISSMTHPCRCCTIAEAQLHHSQSNCSKFIEYKTSIENLQNTLKQQDKQTLELLQTLYNNTTTIQDKYLKIMNCLYLKTKNKTRWNETIEVNKKNISESMKKYVEDSINKI